MTHSYSLPQPEPLLIVLSGPSGVGKDSLLAQLQATQAEGGLSFHFVITATNRPPRPNEVHGRDYFFVSTEEFATLIDNDELLEYANVYGQYKGIPKQQVREALASGRDVVMRLDVQGALTIKSMYPDAVIIFIATENEEDLIERLTARQTDSASQIKLRVATARKEIQRIPEFDYCVVNRANALVETTAYIAAIITAEHHRVTPRKIRI